MIMKTQWVLVVGLAVVVALGCVAAQTGEPSNEQDEQEAQAFNSRLRSDFRLPKMFDFERFKSNFKKSYESSLEEMFRAKLFMARAYRAFISAVKYKFRAAKYYLGVNSRTDRTRKELDATLNHALENDLGEEESSAIKAAERNAEVDENPEPLVEPADIADELKRIHEHKDEPGFRELDAELAKMRTGANSRRKREADTRRRAPRADFELSAAYDRRKSSNRGTLGGQVPSNNPNYEQPDVASELSHEELKELPGWRNVFYRDVRYGIKRRDYTNLPVKSKYTTRDKSFLVSLTRGFVSGAQRMWSGFKNSLPAKGKPVAEQGESGESGDWSDSDSDYEDAESQFDELDEHKPDVVWVDHREGGCMQPVQDQGECGSCWAFASMAYFEWAHCHETGSPVKFSEQYLVDCASRINNMNGCAGAPTDMVGVFVHNYGIEMARHYPYKERVEQCPYEEKTEPQKMGYLRVESTEVVRVPLELIEEYLPNMPMIVSINTNGDLPFYGGGVYDGRQCEQRGHHAVLLVGHGREDDEEYWLIRNSYSTDWGEQGYLRLNKNSDCITPKHGRAFGKLLGTQMHVYTQRNWRIPTRADKSAKAPATTAAKRKIDDEAFERELKLQKRRV